MVYQTESWGDNEDNVDINLNSMPVVNQSISNFWKYTINISFKSAESSKR